jgi:hypothetical protein
MPTNISQPNGVASHSGLEDVAALRLSRRGLILLRVFECKLIEMTRQCWLGHATHGFSRRPVWKDCGKRFAAEAATQIVLRGFSLLRGPLEGWIFSPRGGGGRKIRKAEFFPAGTESFSGREDF